MRIVPPTARGCRWRASQHAFNNPDRPHRCAHQISIGVYGLCTEAADHVPSDEAKASYHGTPQNAVGTTGLDLLCGEAPAGKASRNDDEDDKPYLDECPHVCDVLALFHP
eukprot:scaffold4971_cov254-Pinguiococcus_pyrenoidosus.AAC.20